jgi:hypothetical protein
MTPDQEHRYFDELAVAHVVGGLDESEGRVFRAHLLDCDECRARVYELRTIAQDLTEAERDERRVRAAKAIETKRREADEDDFEGEEPLAPARSARAVVLVGLLLMMLLAAWNFTLRGANVRLESTIDSVLEAASIVEYGTPWAIAGRQTGIRGTVKEEGQRVVVLIDEANADTVYGVYVLNQDGNVLRSDRVPSVNERVRLLFDKPDHAATLVVTDPGRGSLPGAEPQGSGTVVLTATAPGP